MKYIINDRKKLLFLEKDTILFEDKEGPQRLILNQNDYKTLVKYNSSYTVFKSEDISETLFNKLLYHKLIIECPNDVAKSLNTKFERTNLFFYNYDLNIDIKDLKQKVIMFIGAGGICSEIINQLLAVGISNFIIVDFDNINVSNLNRQFIYKPKDIGKSKIDILKKYIKNVEEDANIICIDKRVQNENDLIKIIKKYSIDFIVNAADTPPMHIQKIILEASLIKSIPVLFGGVGIFDGYIGPLFSNDSSKIEYIKNLNKYLSKIKFAFPCKSSFGVTNTLISTLMSWDIIFYLANSLENVKSLNKRINLNFKEMLNE